MDHLAEVYQLQSQRPDLARLTASCAQALLEPAVEGGLSRRDRAMIALRVAWLTPNAVMARHHRQRLIALGHGATIERVEQFPDTPGLDSRDTLILAHASRLTTPAIDTRSTHLETLLHHGLATRDIVTMTQLVAFTAFQARVVAGLAMNKAATPPPAGPPAPAGFVIQRPAQNHPPAYTLQPLHWRPWLDVVTLDTATPEQADALREVAPSGKVLPFYAVLGHDPAALRERARLYKAIMYGPSGLSRAERELVGLVASRVGGCVYCTSNHGRVFVDLTHQGELAQALIDDVASAPLEPRWRALVDFTATLADTPAALTHENHRRLQEAGLTDLDILDLTHVAAMFAWANRLAEGLGEVEY